MKNGGALVRLCLSFLCFVLESFRHNIPIVFYFSPKLWKLKTWILMIARPQVKELDSAAYVCGVVLFLHFIVGLGCRTSLMSRSGRFEKRQTEFMKYIWKIQMKMYGKCKHHKSWLTNSTDSDKQSEWKTQNKSKD